MVMQMLWMALNLQKVTVLWGYLAHLLTTNQPMAGLSFVFVFFLVNVLVWCGFGFETRIVTADRPSVQVLWCHCAPKVSRVCYRKQWDTVATL